MRTVRTTIGVIATPWVARTILVLALLASNWTIWSVISTETSPPAGPDDRTAEGRALWGELKVLADQMTERINNNPEAYSPAQYFADMVEIKKKKHELGLNLSGVLFEHWEQTNSRWQVFNSNMNAERFTYEDLVRAREKILDAYESSLIDPRAQPRPRSHGTQWQRGSSAHTSSTCPSRSRSTCSGSEKEHARDEYTLGVRTKMAKRTTAGASAQAPARATSDPSASHSSSTQSSSAGRGSVRCLRLHAIMLLE